MATGTLEGKEVRVRWTDSYAAATERTPEQANGIMVIPKACVTCVTCLCETKASCPERFFILSHV